MACNQHDKDYLKSLEEAYPLSQLEREAKEMTERAELARIEKSDQYVKVLRVVAGFELNEKLNDNGK